jgi:hypothetical protein
MTSWRSRETLELTNGIVRVTLLPRGGQMAAWRFADGQGPTQENTLWEPLWTTSDPGTPAHTQFAEGIGDIGVGRFLGSFTGHSLCLDGFGPATEAEVAHGSGLHGEASIVNWSFSRTGENSAVGKAKLPLAHLSVTRKISLRAGESVLRVMESVTNLAETGHNVHWVQHATIGQPMFSGRSARIAASVHEGVTWPLEYDGKNLLAQDTGFVWPLAPRKGSEDADLRELFVQQGTGFVAAAQQRPGREQGFVAVYDTERRLVIGYLFAAAVFPWVTFWEENQARQEPPWCGAVLARGLEFGTTPLPLGNEAVDARGPLLGMPTNLHLGAKATQRAPWMLFLAEIPAGCGELQDVSAEQDEIVLRFESKTIRLPAEGAAGFLRADRGQQKVEAA